MRKIALFIDDLSNSGGTERLAVLTANKFIEKGYKVIIITLKPYQSSFFHLDEQIEVFSCHNLYTNRLVKRFCFIKRLRHILIEKKIDILITIDTLLSIYSIPSVFFTTTYNIVWEQFRHGINLGIKLRDISRFFASIFATHIVLLTKNDKIKWSSIYPWAKKRMSVIYNPSQFTITNNKYCSNSRTLIAVGRLTEQKGFDILIRIWSRLHAKNNDWKLKIIGSGKDQQKLMSLAEELGVRESTIFSGQVKNMVAEYESSSIFCFSSRFEGIGLVLIEAQSCGLPLISFDCKYGPSEIINGKNGVLVNGFDEDIYSLELQKMMENEELRENMSAQSKINAENFTLEKFSESWVYVISNMDK